MINVLFVLHNMLRPPYDYGHPYPILDPWIARVQIAQINTKYMHIVVSFISSLSPFSSLKHLAGKKMHNSHNLCQQKSAKRKKVRFNSTNCHSLFVLIPLFLLSSSSFLVPFCSFCAFFLLLFFIA